MSKLHCGQIAILLTVLLTITGCPGENRVAADVKLLSVEDGLATLDVYGYAISCVTEPMLFAHKDGRWVQVEQDLPVEFYTLDGEWIGGASGYCDYVGSCDLIEQGDWQPGIRFVEYKEIGDREYQTAPVSGPKKVVIDIYEDDKCVSKRRFEFVIDE